MSSFSRNMAAALIVGFALSGCALEPALRSDRPAASLPKNFDISVPGGRSAFRLEERLLVKLGSSGGAAEFKMAVELGITEGRASAADSGGVDRISLSGTAEFEVTDAGTGDLLIEDNVRGRVTFSSNDEIIASGAAREDAERRLIRLLSDRIVSRLILTAQDWLSLPKP